MTSNKGYAITFVQSNYGFAVYSNDKLVYEENRDSQTTMDILKALGIPFTSLLADSDWYEEMTSEGDGFPSKLKDVKVG